MDGAASGKLGLPGIGGFHHNRKVRFWSLSPGHWVLKTPVRRRFWLSLRHWGVLNVERDSLNAISWITNLAKSRWMFYNELVTFHLLFKWSFNVLLVCEWSSKFVGKARGRWVDPYVRTCNLQFLFVADCFCGISLYGCLVLLVFFLEIWFVTTKEINK